MKLKPVPETGEQVLFELTETLQTLFKDREYFACIYGSFVRRSANHQSDIDLFVAVSELHKDDVSVLKARVIELHERYGLMTDDEVPFENKLVVVYEDISDAIKLEPFRLNDSLYVPPIQKTSVFLASREVRMRLLLNALTTPHLFVAGNIKTYSSFKEQAEEAVFRLACHLLNNDRPDAQKALAVLLTGPEGEHGEMYLGYKDDPGIKAYLMEVLAKKGKTA